MFIKKTSLKKSNMSIKQTYIIVYLYTHFNF